MVDGVDGKSSNNRESTDPFGMTDALFPLFDTFGKVWSEALSQAFAPGENAEKIETPGLTDWAKASAQMQSLWIEFLTDSAKKAATQSSQATSLFDPMRWLMLAQTMVPQWPKGVVDAQSKLTKDAFEVWKSALAQMGAMSPGEENSEGNPKAAVPNPVLPHKDRRFSDPAWRETPASILLHQFYLMIGEYIRQSVQSMEGLPDDRREPLEFAVNALTEAMSPGNYLLTNPVVLNRTIETQGQNLVKGLQHLIADLKRGQLTHTDPDAFRLGENIATTPGKVIHETPLYQLIQYSPSTKDVHKVPLIIFPPWINRFYILDLNAKKSFVKWAVDQGLTVFMVSWRSADETIADVVWDDYIRAQVEAIEQVRERLKVPQVHTIGYCVAGTTLAATLAILSRRGQADRVKSATFFTAQVDFERSGDLKHFIDDPQMEMIEKLSPDGYLDGRYLAATFNALRGKDLIWNYVVNNYLLGEDYPAFDLLHWNGDVTNLPAKWHNQYLRELYRDNQLVVPDALEADGTPIDLSCVEVPTYVQAGKEDHIAPAESVWRITDHFQGPLEFLLAGSGHIAGVVNPPAANKYQYWVGDSGAANLDAFVESATEHPGSWWPHWLEWLESQDSGKVTATGKRKPGGRGDKVIEDAPGRYVKTR